MIDATADDVRATGEILVDLLSGALGARPRLVGAVGDAPAAGAIRLTKVNADASFGEEGYELRVTPDSIVICAPSSAGLFYGVQTLRQLLPPAIESGDKVGDVLRVPCVAIKDSPRFRWRGLMLDVSRHFFDKREVEKFLDLMALHKLNVFHWHLTDDQGWRIEIKKYPRLTEIGAWRDGIGFGLDPTQSTHYDDKGRYGGFYTQDDVREIVAYAARLHITIVPEIEMPGHSLAALVAYPRFFCPQKDIAVATSANVMTGLYNVGEDQTFEFLEDILSEVMDLFPSLYVHVGGDEVGPARWHANAACQARMKAEGLKNEKELQSYFVRRIDKFLSSKGRHLIGWDEILKGGLAPGATVMSWRGVAGGIAAAQAGHDVVLSPISNAYFNLPQVRDDDQPKEAAGFLTLRMVYSFDPIPPELSPEQAAHVLGAQGNLWTENVPNLKQAEYMAFPRACAMAEVTWSPKSRINWADFIARLAIHEERLKALGVNYFDDPALKAGSASTKSAPAK